MSIISKNFKYPYYTQFNDHLHIKYLYEKKPKKLNALQISTFLLTGVKEAFYKLSLPDDHYIMCVKYKAGDAQLFVTGSVEAYELEDTSKTAIEELKEETRFLASKVTFVDKFENNKCVFDTYHANINDLRAINMPPVRKTEQIADGKKHKITCIVHGNKSELKRIVSNIKKSTNDKSNDDIDGLVFISVRHVKKIIDIIDDQKSKKQFNPFLCSFASLDSYIH